MDDLISPQNGWSEYRRLVLSELERLHKGQLELRNEIAQLRRDTATELAKVRSDIAMLKIKSGVWGAAAGLIPAIIAILLTLMKG